MTPDTPRVLVPAALCLVPLLLAMQCSSGGGRVIVVGSGESIQEAVDLAAPGTTIKVKPGIYTGTPGDDSVVDIQKDGIRIIGSHGAIIDATGFEYGIMVGPDAAIGPAGCPPIAVHDFEIDGLTIRNADDTGVRLVAVDGFKMVGSVYEDNYEYGPFPICSRNGTISLNHVSGHNDAGIYVGDDENVHVLFNYVTDNVAGIELENSLNTSAIGNHLEGNTGAILVFVGPNLPMPFLEDAVIAENVIVNNNRQNTGTGAVAGVPEGTGILVFGSDDVTIQDNQIQGNDSFGIGVIGNFNAFLDPRIEPFNDNLLVDSNDITGNGTNPDPLRTFTPGADVIFLPDVFDPTTGMLLLTDPDPSDNCFSNNTIGTDFPPGIVAAFPCP